MQPSQLISRVLACRCLTCCTKDSDLLTDVTRPDFNGSDSSPNYIIKSWCANKSGLTQHLIRLGGEQWNNMCAWRCQINSRRRKRQRSRRQLHHTWSSRPLTSAPDITANARETGSAEITTGSMRRRRRRCNRLHAVRKGAAERGGFHLKQKKKKKHKEEK